MNSKDWREQTERVLEELAGTPQPNPLRQASARKAYLEQASRLRAAGHARSRGRAGFGAYVLRAAVISVVMVLLSLGALTGVAAAADRALPGDLLYPLDLAMEKLQLSSAHEPAERVALLLDFAGERLDESRQLSSRGETAEMDTALEAYDQILVDLAGTVDDAPKTEQPALEEQLNETLTIHQQQLVELRLGAPEQAWPGLDRAIEASQNSHGGQGGNRPDKTSGPPEDHPDNPHGHGPDKTPGPPDGVPGNPHGNPNKTPGSP